MDQVTKFACFLLVSRCKLNLSLSQDHNNHCLVSVTKRLELWTSPQKKRNKPDLNRSLKILYELSHMYVYYNLLCSMEVGFGEIWISFELTGLVQQ
jgi:hypothetical protein